jgi:hypothetical protein
MGNLAKLRPYLNLTNLLVVLVFALLAYNVIGSLVLFLRGKVIATGITVGDVVYLAVLMVLVGTTYWRVVNEAPSTVRRYWAAFVTLLLALFVIAGITNVNRPIPPRTYDFGNLLLQIALAAIIWVPLARFRWPSLPKRVARPRDQAWD